MIKKSSTHYRDQIFNNPQIHAQNEKLKFNINFNRKVIAFDYGNNSKNFIFLKKQHELERKIQMDPKPLADKLNFRPVEVANSGEFRMRKGYFRKTVGELLPF